MANPISTSIKADTAVLVGVILQRQSEVEVHENLDELEFLAETAGAQTIKRFIQKVDVPNPRTFIGSGKVLEIKEYVEQNEIDIIIFDDELSPTQLRNLEKEFERRILDRTNLILDVFA